ICTLVLYLLGARILHRWRPHTSPVVPAAPLAVCPRLPWSYSVASWPCASPYRTGRFNLYGTLRSSPTVLLPTCAIDRLSRYYHALSTMRRVRNVPRAAACPRGLSRRRCWRRCASPRANRHGSCKERCTSPLVQYRLLVLTGSAVK